MHPVLQFGEFIHYGCPLITGSNTVVVPIKTGANSFAVEAFNGSDGSVLWTQHTDYQVPSASFTPSFGPVLSKDRLIMPAAGGTVLVRTNPDNSTGTTARLAFFGLNNFRADPTAYKNNVQINTTITADSNGNIYFGFQVTGLTPLGLQSGLARILADGQGTWISASFAANDFGITKVAMNCAPALSADGRVVYVAVNSFDFGFGYLPALNSRTLLPINSEISELCVIFEDASYSHQLERCSCIVHSSLLTIYQAPELTRSEKVR